MKANYQPNQRVRFIKTSSATLDGVEGTLIGVSADHAEMSYYIVKLDTLLPDYPWSAIVITEHCLEAI